MYFGILLASFGPSIALQDFLPAPLNVLLGPMMIVLGLSFFILSKKYLIKPRIGTVKYGRKRKVRKLKIVVILSVNVVILLILYIFNLYNPSFTLPYLLEGLLFLTLPLCFVAYFIQFNRLYFYAVVFGCTFFLGDISSFIMPIPFNFLFSYFLLGGILIIIGLIYLIRFLRKYPLPQEEISKDV